MPNPADVSAAAPTTLDGHLMAARQMMSRGQDLLPSQSYVVYLDILGFRKLVGKGRETYAKYERAIDGARPQIGPWSVVSSPAGPRVNGPGKLNPPVVFSDSTFVVSKDASAQSLVQACHMANALFRGFLREGLPLRGAIAKGEVWWNVDKGLHMGTGIVTAYELAESLDAIGVALHPALAPPPNAATADFRRNKSSAVECLHVPLQDWGAPRLFPNDGCKMAFDDLTAIARASGEPCILAKYENSVEIVSLMLRDPVRF